MKDIIDFADYQNNNGKTLPYDITISHNECIYNHPIAVKIVSVPIEDEFKDVLITSDGIEITNNTTKSKEIQIEILFYKEDGGVFTLNLRFHEGMTYLNVLSYSIPDIVELMLRDKVISR
jgi:hypothetical protein